MSEQIEKAFQESLDEGADRLDRTWPELFATGAVGGIDVSIGILALFVVLEATHNEMLGALAFGLGFIAITLANSELFTENFLIPVTAVVAGKAKWTRLPRLWLCTLATNLVGGWLVVGLVVLALPELHTVAVQSGTTAIAGGITAKTFASGVLGGLVITLMTWMERGTESVPAKLIAAVGAAFLLASAHLHHAVVISLEAFGALQVGARFGYAHWAGMFGWAVLANMVGGLLLVTVLRLVQVGRGPIEAEREQNEATAADGNGRAVVLNITADGQVEHQPAATEPRV
jgi:formate/nitrite transporter FocA (FNT family)